MSVDDIATLERLIRKVLREELAALSGAVPAVRVEAEVPADGDLFAMSDDELRQRERFLGRDEAEVLRTRVMAYRVEKSNPGVAQRLRRRANKMERSLRV